MAETPREVNYSEMGLNTADAIDRAVNLIDLPFAEKSLEGRYLDPFTPSGITTENLDVDNGDFSLSPHLLNEVGNICTLGPYIAVTGKAYSAYPTLSNYRPLVSIPMCPKGGILTRYSSDGKLKDYVSLSDAGPTLFIGDDDSLYEGNASFAPSFPLTYGSLMPSGLAMSLVYTTESDVPTFIGESGGPTPSLSESGWYKIVREFSGEAKDYDVRSSLITFSIGDLWELNLNQGKIASCLIPSSDLRNFIIRNPAGETSGPTLCRVDIYKIQCGTLL